MRELVILFFVFITFSCSNTREEEFRGESKIMKKVEKYSVAFYNVENLFDTEDDPFTSDDEFTPLGEKEWDEERYSKKIKNIGKVIKGIDSDLPIFFGLCEVENEKVLLDLANSDNLVKGKYGVIHYDSPDTRGIDVGLLYKKDFFEVLDTESLAVIFKDNPNVLTRDILYVKGVLNNEEVHVFVNHWSSRRKGEKETEYKRLTAANVLKDKIEYIQEKDKKAKILVMGDFNDYPNNKSIEDVLEASLQPKSDEFYNLAAKLDRSEKGTHFYNEEWGMLDQMMVSNSWLISKKGNVLKKKSVDVYREDEVLFQHRYFGGIPNKTYSGNKYHGGYSDHLAIYLKLEFRK
jgi:predicted extracellular nuclease